MRKVELLRRHSSPEKYDTLVSWGQSFLITRVALMEKRAHSGIDLKFAGLTLGQLYAEDTQR